MDIIIYALGATATIGLAIFGVLYGTENKSIAIWLFFISTTAILLGLTLLWLQSVQKSKTASRSYVKDRVKLLYSSNIWSKTNGPYGGAVESLLINPFDPNNIYAGLAHGQGIFESLDGGQTWTHYTQWPSKESVSALAITPSEPQIFWAGTKGGLLYKVKDEVTWKEVDYFKPLGDANVRSISISKQSPNLIYCATGIQSFSMTVSSGTGLTVGGIGGKDIGLKKVEWVEDLKEGHLHRSTDGGLTWTSSGFPSINSVVIAPTDSAVIYAASSDCGVFISTDGGINWNVITLPDEDVIYSISVSPFDSGCSILGSRTGAYISNNFGNTWKEVTGIGKQEVAAICISPLNKGIVYAGTKNGVYESIDFGSSFKQTGRGLLHSRILSLLASTENRIFAGTDGLGVFRRSKHDQSWISPYSSLGRLGVTSLAFDANGFLYVGTPVGLFRSENNGSTFQALGYFGGEAVWSLAVLETLPPKSLEVKKRITWAKENLIVIGTENSKIMRSIDSGSNWNTVAKNFSGKVLELKVCPSNNSIIFAVFEDGGIARSADSGETWELIGDDIKESRVSTIAFDPQIPENIYAGTVSGKLFRSPNWGNSWELLSLGLPQKPISTISLSVIPVKRLWIGFYEEGIYSAIQNKNSWELKSHGLKNHSVISIPSDCIIKNRIFVGTENGVFLSENNGDTWRSFNVGIEEKKYINALAISPDGKMLFAAESTMLYGILIL